MTNTNKNKNSNYYIHIARLVIAFLICTSYAEKASPIIGIDLGTTYSCVGIYKNGKVEILANDQGLRTTASWVAFTNEERIIGDGAKNQAAMNPENTVFDVKRLIGRDFSDKEVQRDMKLMPYKIIDKGGKPFIEVSYKGEKKTFAPEEISSMILTKMKETAEAHLGKKVEKAVITVPAYFTDAQRRATKDAGAIAGLDVVRIINEPTAAALAYGMDSKNEKNILVFDLGGGTFDVSILTVEQQVFEVIATNGDTHLGGEDFDQRVIDYLLKVWQKKTGDNTAAKDKRAVARLKKAVENSKKALSSSHQTTIEIENFHIGQDFSQILTRAKFEELNNDLFKRTLEPVKKILADAKMKKEDIDDIVLVGGSTRIPKIQQLLKDFFNGKEPSRGVNPDEAVAYGAAVQGAVLGKDFDDSENDNIPLLIDICPLSLGIETAGGIMTNIIDRNSYIPNKKSKVFSTYEDNQEKVNIKIYEGERAMVKDNHFLGEFELSGISPSPRGVPQIEVTFEIDANNILHVTAIDKATQNTKEITISDKTHLSEKERDEMIFRASEATEEDRLLKERIEAKNNLENLLYSAKRLANEDNSNNVEEEREELMKIATEGLEWMDNNERAEKEEIEERQREIEQIALPLMKKIYDHREPEDVTNL